MYVFPFTCAAPWIHLHSRANGEFGLCCNELSPRINAPEGDFESFWNGETMKSIRVQMMNNEIPESCKRCAVHASNNKAVTRRDNMNTLAQSRAEEIVQSTTPDGATTFVPYTIDVRTDFCNLACRMCNPTSSTKIANAMTKHNVKFYSKRGAGYRRADVVPDYVIQNVSNVYWAGGEPVMSPTHWTVMDRLVELNKTNLYVSYNTNCTFPGNTLSKFVNTLRNFSNVNISISFDSLTKAELEYLRVGVNYDQAIANLKTLQTELPNAKLYIDATVTSIGLLTLADTLRKMDELGIMFKLKIMILNSTNPHLHVNVLKRDIVEQCIAECRNACIGRPWEKHVNTVLNLILTQYSPAYVNWNHVEQSERLFGNEGWFAARTDGMLNIPE